MTTMVIDDNDGNEGNVDDDDNDGDKSEDDDDEYDGDDW